MTLALIIGILLIYALTILLFACVYRVKDAIADSIFLVVLAISLTALGEYVFKLW